LSAAGPVSAEGGDLTEFVERRRARYIALFETFVAEQKQGCTVGASELKIQPNLESSLFQNLCCVDFVTGDGEYEVVLLGSESVAGLETISASFGAAVLSIDALLWDDVIIRHDVASIPPDTIAGWFRRWFDQDDERHDPDAELSNNVHSLRVKPGLLEIDFGTAPTDAFWEMLELLEGAGASHIRIGVSSAD
jgi:hypothetical protein